MANEPVTRVTVESLADVRLGDAARDVIAVAEALGRDVTFFHEGVDLIVGPGDTAYSVAKRYQEHAPGREV